MCRICRLKLGYPSSQHRRPQHTVHCTDGLRLWRWCSRSCWAQQDTWMAREVRFHSSERTFCGTIFLYGNFLCLGAVEWQKWYKNVNRSIHHVSWNNRWSENSWTMSVIAEFFRKKMIQVYFQTIFSDNTGGMLSEMVPRIVKWRDIYVIRVHRWWSARMADTFLLRK